MRIGITEVKEAQDFFCFKVKNQGLLTRKGIPVKMEYS